MISGQLGSGLWTEILRGRARSWAVPGARAIGTQVWDLSSVRPQSKMY